MGFFDRFRKTKTEEVAQDEDGGIEPLPEAEDSAVEDIPVVEDTPVKKRGAHDWAIFLAINSVLLIGSVGLLAARVFHHLTAPAVVTAQAPKPKPKPKAVEKKVEPEVKKEAPPKKEAPKPKAVKKEEPKKPLPKPSLALKTAPVRKTPAPQSSSAEIKPIKSAKKRVTRPVSFKHRAVDAKQVDLLGMFLVRTQGRKRMFKDSKGVWRSTVYLKTGQTYDFKFEVIDAKGRKRTGSTQRVTVP